MSYLIESRLDEAKKGNRCRACAIHKTSKRPLNKVNGVMLCQQCIDTKTTVLIGHRVFVNTEGLEGIPMLYNGITYGSEDRVRENRTHLVSFIATSTLDKLSFQKHPALYGNHGFEVFFAVKFNEIEQKELVNSLFSHTLDKSY